MKEVGIRLLGALAVAGIVAVVSLECLERNEEGDGFVPSPLLWSY